MLRGRDVQELKELQRQGMCIQAISELTGWDRKTIRKYVQAAGWRRSTAHVQHRRASSMRLSRQPVFRSALPLEFPLPMSDHGQTGDSLKIEPKNDVEGM